MFRRLLGWAAVLAILALAYVVFLITQA